MSNPSSFQADELGYRFGLIYANLIEYKTRNTDDTQGRKLALVDKYGVFFISRASPEWISSKFKQQVSESSHRCQISTTSCACRVSYLCNHFIQSICCWRTRAHIRATPDSYTHRQLSHLSPVHIHFKTAVICCQRLKRCIWTGFIVNSFSYFTLNQLESFVDLHTPTHNLAAGWARITLWSNEDDHYHLLNTLYRCSYRSRI